MKFQKITVCLDMYGCPNRCAHCWIGHSPNGNLAIGDLEYVVQQFRPFADSLEVDDWYREPDYKDNYRQLWELTNAMSDTHEPHFELASIWRLARDPDYAPWLASLGVKRCQITLFGREKITDRYTGRKGAYQDILKAMEVLLEQKIAPRIQFFLNRETVEELPFLEKLIRDLALEERCRAFGEEFVCFLHAGSCDGENEKHYDIWPTAREIERIPESLARSTKKHFGVEDIMEVFGMTEGEAVRRLHREDPRESLMSQSPVFYVDRNFDVYPNVSAPSPSWRLGNLKTDGVEKVLRSYIQNESPAQKAWAELPMEKLLEAGADPDSDRLFLTDDYLVYLVNQYCKRKMREEGTPCISL